MKQYLRILSYLWPYKGLFCLSILAMIAFGALDAFSFTLLIPFLDILFQEEGGAGSTPGNALFGPGADDFVHRLLEWTVGGLIPADSPMEGLRNVVLVMFVVFLLRNTADYAQTYTVTLIEQRVTRDLRNQIYGHLLRLGFPFFQRTRAGQIISRMTSDVDQLRTLVTRNLANAFSNTIQTIFLLSTLLALSWKLTVVTALTFPVMLALWNRLRERLRHGVLRALDAFGDLSAHIQETVTGIRLVKASGAEAWEQRRFQELTRRHYKAVIRNERWRQLFPPATEMVAATGILALLWYGSRLVLVDREIEAEAFFAFLGIAMRLMSPVKWLGKLPSLVQPGLAAAERAFELLDTAPEIVERADARPVNGFREAIRFEGVSFAYTPGEEVLREIDLELRPGEVVALVGPSGAGKSTLASLLPRFYDPTAGRITLDGVDLRDLRLSDLRALIGMVTQETILFHDTVRANIAYGLEGVSQEAIEAAARAAHAHDFIMELPDGYDTILGERGTQLSGGERQRIAIARALLRNPPLLILDEATSALDAESEWLVQRAIDELLRGRTVLVIAHRLSTIRRADKIVVLDGGRIVEQGTHEELLARRGVYHRLYGLQLEGLLSPDGREAEAVYGTAARK
ncbi:MAG TPA: ABC transporter ATP-binding protein [Longimicrobiales bacterium]